MATELIECSFSRRRVQWPCLETEIVVIKAAFLLVDTHVYVASLCPLEVVVVREFDERDFCCVTGASRRRP